MSLRNKLSLVKTIVTFALILTVSALVAKNLLFSQSNMARHPGATAVKVQVEDYRDEGDLDANQATSITRLLNQTSPVAARPANTKLTRSLQRELAEIGLYFGKVDGRSGPQTLAAIKRYQYLNGLPQTGKATNKLLEHMVFTRKIARASEVTGSIKLAEPQVQPDEQVRRVQERLRLFGYNPGKSDGVAGSATRNAIRTFEADRSLTVTGKISPQLLAELGIS